MWWEKIYYTYFVIVTVYFLFWKAKFGVGNRRVESCRLEKSTKVVGSVDRCGVTTIKYSLRPTFLSQMEIYLIIYIYICTTGNSYNIHNLVLLSMIE